jgi:hypothetical protein
LEAEGIIAFVAHEQHATVDWPLTLALGGVKVQVSSEDLESARKVMQSIESGTYASELAEELGDLGETRCPVCHSHDFRTRASLAQVLWLLVSYFMANAPYRIYGSVRRCKVCGARLSDELG